MKFTIDTDKQTITIAGNDMTIEELIAELEVLGKLYEDYKISVEEIFKPVVVEKPIWKVPSWWENPLTGDKPYINPYVVTYVEQKEL